MEVNSRKKENVGGNLILGGNFNTKLDFSKKNGGVWGVKETITNFYNFER